MAVQHHRVRFGAAYYCAPGGALAAGESVALGAWDVFVAVTR